ncbi:tetratricopeptide repeat protein (macronuclear) [Tetrahymena thermophila SB210]|uniref:Tetratricopeptide repeat protein n=1 Tax=Tetrahymena thermophila (strain SB210) TaxID=312017 RepID=Q23C00_TETTS|nr:tetratricopeptide repeat protein [Tetrahymena thermophila SB210]EAR93968.1 tetratricopeptide repeat protein [Tetrahymena thermophila SB210]|eukprot:XP_001014213.1 tetratricopeptide repeat protein [Tetrahymena thermophila SB210]
MNNIQNADNSNSKFSQKRGRILKRNAQNILDMQYGESTISSIQNISSLNQIDEPLNQNYESNRKQSKKFRQNSEKDIQVQVVEDQLAIDDYQEEQEEHQQYNQQYQILEEIYTNATKNIKLGRYEQAIEQLNNIINVTSDNFQRAKAKTQLGTLFQIIQKDELAIEMYTSSLQDYILNDKTHLNIGILYLQKFLSNRQENNKYISNALNHLNQSIKLNPRNYEANFNIACAFLEQNNQSQAEVYLNKCIKIDSRNPNAYRVLAGIFHESKKFEKAKEFYINAVKIRPIDTDYYNLGLVCMIMNNFIEAQQFFIKCISVNKEYSTAYINLGLIHFMNNEYDEAEKYYLEAISIDENSFEALSNLGNLYFHKKLYTQAEELYIKAKQVDYQLYNSNQNAFLLLNLGRVQFETQKFDDALNNLMNAFQLDQQLYFSLKIIADIYIIQNQNIKAEVFLEQYLNHESNDADAYFKLANIQYKTLQYNKANKNLNQCLKLKPNHAKALKMQNELKNVVE